MNTLSPEAIAGIVGAIAGSIIGWFLSFIQNTIGKIKINITNFSIEFLTESGCPGGMPEFTSTSPNSPELYKIHMEFDLYVHNNKNFYANISEPLILIKSENQIIKNKIDDYSTKHFTSMQEKFETITVVNLQPKQTDYYRCSLTIYNIRLKSTHYKIYFTYRVNGKNFIHKKEIKVQS